MRTRDFLLKLAIPLILLVPSCDTASAQSTADAISARLKGQPLYLRGGWREDKLKFDADGQPKENYKAVPFTEAGIDVYSVKMSGNRLRITGQRVALAFPNGTPKRMDLTGKNYTGSITIEVQGVPGQDFGKALDAIFAPDLASLVPTMPIYWQDYAQKHLLPPNAEGTGSDPTATADKPIAGNGDNLVHVGGVVKKPTVISSAAPEFDNAARALKFSGNVEVYLWVLEDGSPSHLKIVRPVGMGLDEQALAAVSKYKFAPATLNGNPVKVDLYVDVNFQIF